MEKIKLRNRSSEKIKTLNHDVKLLDRSVSASNSIKNTDGKSPEAALGDMTEQLANNFVYDAGDKITSKVPNLIYSSANKALHHKQSKGTAKIKRKAAKNAVKNIKTVYQNEKMKAIDKVKTKSSSIKTYRTKAPSLIPKKTKSNEIISTKAKQEAIKRSIQVAKATAKATVEAIKVSAEAIKASAEAFVEFLAAGGWVALIILLIVLLLVVFMTSAFGGTMVGDEASVSVRQEINTEFQKKLEEQKASMLEYEKIEVRPAPVITEWDNLMVIFSVRAQKANLQTLEESPETSELLRQTVWDAISFSTSTETIVSNETDENGNTVSVTENYGIINVQYKSFEELCNLYAFTADDKELAQELSAIRHEIGFRPVGQGFMINPCPDGRFNGNDYPAYAGSGEYHAGRDIACPVGTPIYAAADGVVIHVNDIAESYGNHIMLAHGNEIYSVYAHCDSVLVAIGQEVKQGEQIAWSGNTGNTTGPHLHFEVRVGGNKYRVNNVDPLLWIG